MARLGPGRRPRGRGAVAVGATLADRLHQVLYGHPRQFRGYVAPEQ